MITMITAVTEQHIAVIFSTLTDLASRRYYSHHILDKKVSLFLCLFHKILEIKYISGLKIFFLQIKSDKIWSCKTQNSNWRVKSKPELVFEKKTLETLKPTTRNLNLLGVILTLMKAHHYLHFTGRRNQLWVLLVHLLELGSDLG